MISPLLRLENITATLDVLKVEILPLIGLNVLDSELLMIDKVNNKLAGKKEFKKEKETNYLEEW